VGAIRVLALWAIEGVRVGVAFRRNKLALPHHFSISKPFLSLKGSKGRGRTISVNKSFNLRKLIFTVCYLFKGKETQKSFKAITFIK